MFNEPDEESSRVNSLSSRKETVKKRKKERRVILQRIPLDFGIKFLDLKSFDLKEMAKKERKKERKLDE